MANQQEPQDSQQESENNQQEPQANSAGQLSLSLNRSTRNQLATSLIRLSDILQFNKPIAKQVTCKEIEDSILRLVNLSPFEPTQSADDSGGLGQALKLLRSERSNVINHLVDIKDAVLFGQKVIDEAKRNLITENERMVVRLMKLSREAPSDLACGAKSAEDANEETNENTGEPSSKRQRVELDVTGSNEEFDRLKEQLSGLETTVNELRSELRSQNLQVKNANVTRPDASFKFELTDVSKFLKTSTNKHYSHRFWCRGLLWSFHVESQLGLNKNVCSRYLGFSLHCEHNDPVKRSCKAEFQLTLFSKLLGKPNYVYRTSYNFHQKANWGHPLFRSYDELTDKKNGYIEDDKILLGVELKTEPLTRD